MYITNSIKYIGVNDRKTDLFEGQYKIPDGISYNSYIIFGQKTVVMDTVDRKFTDEWLTNLSAALNGGNPDYLVVQHMEPDHSASLSAFIAKYPKTEIVGNKKTFAMINQFFGELDNINSLIVEEGDTLDIGGHVLSFVFAPMVHWPEVMLTYDITEKVLFSADAFGKFGALDTDGDWTEEARRYYIGIVGKYGVQVQNLLKKLAGTEVSAICPLHGPVISENIERYIGLYDKWSSYTPEEKGVLIAYTSVYGNTEKAVNILAEKLKESGNNVKICDLARCDMSASVADAFRYDRLVLATTTYNGDIFPAMKIFVDALTERNYQDRKIGIIENGTWAPQPAKIFRAMFEKSKNIVFADNAVTVRSAVNEKNIAEIDALSRELSE